MLVALVGACGRSQLEGPPEDTAGTGGSSTGGSGTGSPDAGVCAPGATEPCYTGPLGTAGVGICTIGTKTCNLEGTAYSACTGEVLPAAETCATQQDDDCDGQVNEDGAGCMCVPGSTAPCYGGPPNTEGIGICHAGTQVCNPEGTGYGDCSAEVTPSLEDCAAPEDEDCDGQADLADDDCFCAPGSTTPCYTGPFGTDGLGMCHGGTQTCKPDGLGYGACIGEVTPAPETCNTPGDDNCNGFANEEGDGCVCFPNTVIDCYSGPDGTEGKGICHGGSRICNAQGTAFGDCVGEVLPGVETCDTPEDDDCNGVTNESGTGCVCFPETILPCPYSGPPGTEGVGTCQAATKTCNTQGTAFSPCIGEVLPKQDMCNKKTEIPEDENCDGQINEGACEVVAISAGGLHSMALRGDGTVWTWGSDQSGQLGDSLELTSQSIPVMAVKMIMTFAIAAGGDHSLGLRFGDDVWSWGDNHDYQLGKGWNQPPFPYVNIDPYAVYVYNFSDIAAIAAGRAHSMAIRADNTVWTWGTNDSGQLGIGTTGGNTMTPVQVLNLPTMSAIAAGNDHALALRPDGILWTWGKNSFGQLGDGTFLDRSIPMAIFNNVTAIDGGGAHSIALRSDGTLWAWGDNALGQLGDGSTSTHPTPTLINLTNVIGFSAGAAHSLAVTSSNTVRAWGWNQLGQLGNGTNTDSPTPVAVLNLTAVTAVAAGGAHSLALRADGTVWAWGRNSDGQLGDGTTTDRTSPVEVLFP
jgi:alpha-tubulin suppressor-like RCC1 family protein